MKILGLEFEEGEKGRLRNRDFCIGIERSQLGYWWASMPIPGFDAEIVRNGHTPEDALQDLLGAFDEWVDSALEVRWQIAKEMRG